MTDREDEPSESATSVLAKACENCRVRKIRCDKRDPCSNCRTARIACRPAARVIEHRPRVNLSSRYEKQIEAIHERLVGIEAILKKFSNSMKKGTIDPGSDQLSSEHVTPSDSHTAFEGDSSFTKHTIQASHAAELTATETVGQTPNPEVADALKSLQTLIGSQNSTTSEKTLYFSGQPVATLPDTQLLPSSFVIFLLKKVKARVPASFLMYAWRDYSQLERLCQKVYFPTEPVSPGSVTMMHGMLAALIREYLELKDPELMDFDCESYLNFCERRFYQGIETYAMLTVPSFEHIQCLLIGIVQAQQTSRPSLCWALTSAAARSCQALGYHRKSALEDDSFLDAECKRHLFWTVYTFDKNMSLNLGRASVTQDYDVDAELFTPCSDPSIQPWDLCALAWIGFARLQGQVYDRVYSVAARKNTPEERREIVKELHARLEDWRNDYGKIRTDESSYRSLCEHVMAPLDIVYYSVLTLLHRVPSLSSEATTEVDPACYEAAKLTLQSHLGHCPKFLIGGLWTRTAYVNWTLLYCSFTPFIVVFLQAIATLSFDDVQLLDNVVQSLEHFREVSEASERLYQVCKVFFRVAHALIASKQTNLDIYNAPDTSLVFPHVSGDYPLPEMFSQDDSNVRSADFNGMSTLFDTLLGGNQSVMDLLNMDFADYA